MEKQVIYRDRQELQAADLNNTQEFTQAALDHLVEDAVTGTERYFTGFDVAKKSATEITVTPGRLYQSGQVYANELTNTLNLFQYLPLQTKIKVAIVLWGQEADETVEARDFLIDAATGTTEPQAVAMTRIRAAQVNTLPGVEAADPQAPVLQSGTMAVAYVTMTPEGIETIDQVVDNALPNLADVERRTDVIEAWKSIAEPRLSTLASDVAGLAQTLNGIANTRQIREMAADIAHLKELADLPDTFASYGADHFITADETDPLALSYDARVEEGVRPAWAGDAMSQLDLFNPYETAVKNFTGFILPAHTEVARLDVQGYAGSLAISQYQYQEHYLTIGTMSRRRIRYGETRTECTNSMWWRSGYYDPQTGIFYKDGETYTVEWTGQSWNGLLGHDYVRVQRFWDDWSEEPYVYTVTTNNTIQGSQIAQTFLNSQNGWLTRLGLWFTDVDSQGPVFVHLCETEHGKPNLDRCISTVTLQPADLKRFPEETPVYFPPTYLAAGKRYALVLTTSGNHAILMVDGTEYTQGTLFYSLDGDYYQGDFTKDLRMRMYYAQFSNPLTVVDLKPAQLVDGITDLDILVDTIVPPSCEMHFEYQVNGKWTTIAPGTAAQLASKPAMLPLRVVFVGSTDVMPGLGLVGSVFHARRPKTAFTHVSTSRVLGAATSTVHVQTLLEGWDGVAHTFDAKLRYNGIDVDASSSSDEIRPSGILRTSVFDLSTQADPANQTTSNYQVVLTGSTVDERNHFHVSHRIDVAF